MSTYAPPVQAHHRPHINPWLVAVIGLVAALVALGSWVIVDRYTGGGGAVENATNVLDNFYAVTSSPAGHDSAAVMPLFTSDAVMWTNGNKYVGAGQISNAIGGTPDLTVKRIAPVTVWGDFASTYVQFKLLSAGINGPMLETVQLKNGKIFRLWDFALGVTPPFTNTAVPSMK